MDEALQSTSSSSNWTMDDSNSTRYKKLFSTSKNVLPLNHCSLIRSSTLSSVAERQESYNTTIFSNTGLYMENNEINKNIASPTVQALLKQSTMDNVEDMFRPISSSVRGHDDIPFLEKWIQLSSSMISDDANEIQDPFIVPWPTSVVTLRSSSRAKKSPAEDHSIPDTTLEQSFLHASSQPPSQPQRYESITTNHTTTTTNDCTSSAIYSLKDI
jgi:hypothetical protein